MSIRRVAVVFGTRPEAIKLAPVVNALAGVAGMEPLVVCTGQHDELLAPVLDLFELTPVRTLDVMQRSQSLADTTALVLTGVSEALAELEPAYVIVHGDTSTTMASALAAFYARIPVGHVEAGLRTRDIDAPFPEELNRRLVASIARHHFAPTAANRENLLALGVPDERILVTGNTVLDALSVVHARNQVARTRAAGESEFWETLGLETLTELLTSGTPWALVTAHRRESFGAGLENVCDALLELAHRRPDWRFVFPVHLNPRVDGPVRRRLGGHPQIRLLAPLRYDAFVALLSRTWLVLTDSGGLQEETPALGRRVVVMREQTERPEVVATGDAVVAGTDPAGIVAKTIEAMAAAVAHPPPVLATPREVAFGDGRSANRIARFLDQRL